MKVYRYQSLPALPMSNNYINLAFLKNNCTLYFISASVVSIIKIVLKISDADNRKFKVKMT